MTATCRFARITFPDGNTALTDDKSIVTQLTSSLGKPVRLLNRAPASGTLEEYWPDIDGLARRDVVTDEAMPAETFFDLGMIHLLTTTTIDSYRALYPEGRFEPRRFRPNIVIQTASGTPGFPENDWDEKILAIGSQVKIQITGPCGLLRNDHAPPGRFAQGHGNPENRRPAQPGARGRLRVRVAWRHHSRGGYRSA